jgi:hypothetical protein
VLPVLERIKLMSGAINFRVLPPPAISGKTSFGLDRMARRAVSIEPRKEA